MTDYVLQRLHDDMTYVYNGETYFAAPSPLNARIVARTLIDHRPYMLYPQPDAVNDGQTIAWYLNRQEYTVYAEYLAAFLHNHSAALDPERDPLSLVCL
jgi:hypothetical protein